MVKSLRIKPGVSLRGIKPEILLAVIAIEGVYAKYGFDSWITSGTDGKHSPHSLHYNGLAVDFRTRHVSADVLHEMVSLITDRLGGSNGEFDVILEPTHLHVEFDPK